jgi:hypothetical protein
MKASLRNLAVGLGLCLLAPIATAWAQAPSLSPIPNITVNAGGTVTVNVVAVDVDGGLITLTQALPAFATLNAPTIGTGQVVTTMTLSPSAVHVGDYTTAITATAGGVSDTEIFQITVNPAGSNQAPLVGAPALQSGTTGSSLAFTVTATDPDGDVIQSLTASGAPGGATFTPNGTNTSGAFSWTPGSGDAGEYDVLFTATPATGPTASAATHIHVESPPGLTIDPIDDVTVADGSFISVAVHVTGLPGAPITLTASLPSFATLNAPGTGTGSVNTTISVSPPTGSAGTYHASVTATSDGALVTELFDIIVTGTSGGENHAPVLTAPGSATVDIGFPLSFVVSATDPDGDHVDLFGSGLPPGSSFTDHTNNTGTFSWTPVAGQAGTHTASFSGTDGRGGSGSASTVITVGGEEPVNHAPILTAPGSATVDIGSPLSFLVSATDPDGDHVDLSGSGLPSGSSFTDHGNNTGTFSWMPVAGQAGTHTVSFSGTDGRGGTGTASTVITVGGETPGTGGLEATATLIGAFNRHKKFICFKVRPVEGSFDLLLVDLESLRLTYGGNSIPAVRPTHLASGCEGESEGCDPSHVMACFDMGEIEALFGDAELPIGLLDATIDGALTTGGTFAAAIGGKHVHDGERPRDGNAGNQRLSPRVRPNPLNPTTELSFTTSQAGRVRVAIYDMQGRLVATLLDEVRASGEQRLTWDGSNARNQKVASGVYYFQIQTAEGRVVKSVAVVK